MDAHNSFSAQVWPSLFPSASGGEDEPTSEVPALVRDGSDSPASSTIPTPRIHSADNDTNFALGISRKRRRSESSSITSGGHSDVDTDDLFSLYFNLDLIEPSTIESQGSWPSSGSGSGADVLSSTPPHHNPENSTPKFLDPSLFLDPPFSSGANSSFQNATSNDLQGPPTYATPHASPDPTISPLTLSVALDPSHCPSAYQQRADTSTMIEHGHYHVAEQQYVQVASASGSSHGATPSSSVPRYTYVQYNVAGPSTSMEYVGQLANSNISPANHRFANPAFPRGGHLNGTQVGTSPNYNQYSFPLGDPLETTRPFTFQMADIHHQNPPLWPETHQPPSMPSHGHQFTQRAWNGAPPAVSLHEAEGEEVILPTPHKRRRVNAKCILSNKRNGRNTKTPKGGKTPPTMSQEKREKVPKRQTQPPPQHQSQEQPAPARTQPALFRCRCSDDCQVELPPLVRSIWAAHLRDAHNLAVSGDEPAICPWRSACGKKMRGDCLLRHVFKVHIKNEL